MEERKLLAKELKCDCKAEDFNFKTTDELTPFDEGIIGQKRSVKAMDFGLRIQKEGYNIFMAGIPGTGKTTYAKTLARKLAKKEVTPSDLCYVFNFKNPEKPNAIKLPPAKGIKLQNDMNKLIKELKEEILDVFNSEDYENQKNKTMNSFQEQSNELMEEFEKDVQEKGFILQNTAQGPVPVPVDEEGNPIPQEDFQQYSEEKKKEIREENQEIQNEIEKLSRKIKDIKSDAQSELDELEKKIVLSIINPIINLLKEKYINCDEVIKYFDDVKKDISENLDKFKDGSDKTEKKNSLNLKMQASESEDFFIRYEVNLLVNNKSLEGSPVIIETNPTYYNLFGKIEGKSQFGIVTSNFTMIKGGAVHKANGGYLILKAKDVLSNNFSWETLKRILINQEITVENIGEQYRTIPISTIKPEAIDINLKVIIIGTPMIYQLLYNYDDEFKELFKIKADFDIEMQRNKENMNKYASFIASISNREDLKVFEVEAVSKVIEYSSRMAGSRDKLSTRFNDIIELLYEADVWAGINEHDNIQADDVIKAMEEKEYRSNLSEEKIQEMIDKGHILIDTKDKISGQINGLSVYQTGEYSFGRPSRITASTFMGKEGVVNIEREVKMSGKIHNKSVLILSGYLSGQYAKNKPLSLSASIAFEQSYGGIDGDSASCAELIVLLSSIADIPIRQDIAITGSMNQKGVVQPIGGVNEKIEGFYKVCNSQGLTGKQGVVIPVQNIDNLMLKDEVIKAVEEGKFHIYKVSEINEAIEIMMNKPSSEVHKELEKVLDKMADLSEEYDEE